MRDVKRPRSFVMGTVTVILLVCSIAHSKTTITFWSVSYPMRAQSWIENVVIPEFEKTHPGVSVEHAPLTWSNLEDRLVVGLATGLAADVVHYGGTGIYLGSYEDMWYPLNQFMDEWEDTDKIFPESWNLYSRDGTYYGIPLELSPRGILYNKTIFSEMGYDPDEPPNSWSKIVEIAKRGTLVQGDQAVRLGYDNYWDPSALQQTFEHFLDSAGGWPVSVDGRKATLNNLPSQEAFEIVKELFEISRPVGLVRPAAYDADLFANGGSVMTRGLAWSMGVVFYKNPDMIDHVGVFSPRKTPESPAVLQGTINGLAVPRSSKNPELAFEFAAFLANQENSFQYNEYAGGVSVHREAIELAINNESYLLPFYMMLDDLSIACPYPYGSDTWIELLTRGVNGELAVSNVLAEGERAAQASLDSWWSKVRE